MTFSSATMARIIHCCQTAGAAGEVVKDFDKVVLCAPVSNTPVFVVTQYSATGLPTSAAYNLDGTAYAGPLSGLVNCSSNFIESDPLVLCNLGFTFLRWVLLENGQPTGSSFDTDLEGNVFAPDGEVTAGACPKLLSVQGGGIQLAGPVRVLQPEFLGRAAQFNTAGIPGKLFSITVTAFESEIDTNPAITANVVSVRMPDNALIYLANGETRTWSIINDGDDQLLRDYLVRAQGDTYATVAWTFKG